MLSSPLTDYLLFFRLQSIYIDIALIYFWSVYVCMCVLIQMGKFYELFHMDAAIAVSHLGLVYMKVFEIILWFSCC